MSNDISHLFDDEKVKNEILHICKYIIRFTRDATNFPITRTVKLHLFEQPTTLMIVIVSDDDFFINANSHFYDIFKIRFYYRNKKHTVITLENDDSNMLNFINENVTDMTKIPKDILTEMKYMWG